MPGIMFSETVCPRATADRKRYTIALSLLAHAAVFAIAVVMPLVARSELPSPPTFTQLYLGAEVLPSPPPVAPVRPIPPRLATITTSPAAPVEAPVGIGVERGIVLNDAHVDTNSVDGLVEGFGANAIAIDPPPGPAVVQPVRPGGDITPPMRIKHVVPEYPSIARTATVQGVVIIEATIGTDGKVQQARVIRSLPLLDQAALDAVREWEYTPTLLNGRPTPVIMTVTVQFRLK